MVKSLPPWCYAEHPPSSLGLGGLVNLEELNTCPVQLTDTSSLFPPRGSCLSNAQS